jgi:hypothetical protein
LAERDDATARAQQLVDDGEHSHPLTLKQMPTQRAMMKRRATMK